MLLMLVGPCRAHTCTQTPSCSLHRSTGATNLQGDVTLRDGHYISEQDVTMKLQGVYVEASFRLHAVLEPAQLMSMRLEAHDAREHSSDYRSAIAQLQ